MFPIYSGFLAGIWGTLLNYAFYYKTVVCLGFKYSKHIELTLENKLTAKE